MELLDVGKSFIIFFNSISKNECDFRFAKSFLNLGHACESLRWPPLQDIFVLRENIPAAFKYVKVLNEYFKDDVSLRTLFC